jgi:hypothetical protein
MHACTKGLQWQTALGLRKEIPNEGVQSNEISYSGALEACFAADRYIYAVVVLKGLTSDRDWRLSKRNQIICNCHVLSLAASCALVSSLLLSINLESLCSIVVITSKGNNSDPGKGPVLKGGVIKFLKSHQGPVVSKVPGNEGVSLIYIKSMELCLVSNSSLCIVT